jgi:hypothetical protein
MIDILTNLHIYWGNLFTYIFWLAYGTFCWLLWHKGMEMYIWLMDDHSEWFEEKKEKGERRNR